MCVWGRGGGGAVPGARGWSMGTWLVYRSWTLGRDKRESRGSLAGARGPGSGIGSGPTCFVM